MNRGALQVFIGFAVLVGITAALLLRVRSNYVLGQPGVKVVNVPIYNEENLLVADQSVYLPDRIGDYAGTNAPVTKLELAMLPPDTVYGRRLYRASDGFGLSTSVVLMGTDRTSIHKPQYCLTGQGESITGTELITIPISKPHRYDLRVMKLTTTGQQPLGNGKFQTVSGIFLYWFVADGQLTPNHGERMWLMGRDLVTKGLLQRWAYVAYFSRCYPGQEGQLLERMTQFVSASVPEFQTTTGSTAPAQSARILNPLPVVVALAE